ncbi:DNA-binding anti-repressor SinI [Alteribacillus sp. YIM 98480]|nr:DNA-binding anti-repressor SinI [Alteribacillus sp. YIM 98480]
MKKEMAKKELDREWVELIKAARDSGLEKKEIQLFLQEQALHKKRYTV